MNKYLVVAVVLSSFIPTMAFAEGNGPDFPGLQTPNVGVTTAVGSSSSGSVGVTIDHRSDAAYQPSNSFPLVGASGRSSPRKVATANSVTPY
jgi:hypothetical protein